MSPETTPSEREQERAAVLVWIRAREKELSRRARGWAEQGDEAVAEACRVAADELSDLADTIEAKWHLDTPHVSE
jgi:hypothetical protein